MQQKRFANTIRLWFENGFWGQYVSLYDYCGPPSWRWLSGGFGLLLLFHKKFKEQF